MSTTANPGHGPAALVARAVGAVRDHREFERAIADQRALSELLTGPSDVMTATETADLPFAPEAVWAALTDPAAVAHLGTWPVVAAFDLPGPEGSVPGVVGSRRCAVYRLPDGRLEGTVSEVVDLVPGRQVTDRALTSPFPLSTTYAVEPSEGGCVAHLTATGTAPGPIARQMADEWAAGLRHVMWRVRELLGDPAVVGTAAPVRTDEEQAWLDQLYSVEQTRAHMHTVPVTERRAVDLAAPADVVWRLLADVASPVVDTGDPTATRFVVPLADAAAPELLATVSVCTKHGDHLHVEFDEVLERVPMHRVVYRSLRDVRPARTILRLTSGPNACRVEVESTHEVPAVIRRECRRQLKGALERYVELLERHATDGR